MPQRYDIVKIDFQANSRNANAAIEAIRKKSEQCNETVKKLKQQIKDATNANMPADQIDTLKTRLKSATKEYKQWEKSYKTLIKGMRALDEGIKAFNDGSLASNSAAFQKTVNNSAKKTLENLNPLSKDYKKTKRELQALRDATQQNYARMQADTQEVISTITKGGKVSRQAISEELKQQQELLSVLSENDKGYQKAAKDVAILSHYLKAMGGDYEFIRNNISDTKKVSDETLHNTLNELKQTNAEGKTTKKIMRDNSRFMREIRTEQARRVQDVLGGNLGKQSEANIRAAIASAKELVQVYGSSSKKAKDLSAQIVNAEDYLKTVGVEGERAARKQAEITAQANQRLKLMQDRMNNLRGQTHGALIETQKFWQEQLEGANRGTSAYRTAERNLKAVSTELERLNRESLEKSAKQLSRKNLGNLSEQELQASIAAAKQLAQAMKPSSAEYRDLVNNIVRAEEHVKQFGLEGQRSARQSAEQLKEMSGRMFRLSTLSDGALAETKKFWEAQMDGADRTSKKFRQYEDNVKKIADQQQRLVNQQNKDNAQTILGGTDALKGLGENEIRNAINAAREYQKTLSLDTDEYKNLSQAIFNADEYLKQYGSEAERTKLKEEALKESMRERVRTLQNLQDLTTNGLAETKKYWQAQIDGAKLTKAGLAEAETALKKVNEQLTVRTAGKATRIISKPDTYSDNEVRQAIKDLEELRDAQAHGSKQWDMYNQRIQEGKKYLDDWAQADGIMKHEDEMKRLTLISDSALSESKKFWEALVAGTDKGNSSLKDYEANLEKVTQEERERQQIANAEAVKNLGGDLSKLSEGEIRRAIEAGKQLIQTYATGSDEAKNLATQIVGAEKHLEQYGIAAERSAQREVEALQKAADKRAENDRLMEDQLNHGSMLTDSALKAQEQYWQRLIDDPKTAASSLQQYQANLLKVSMLQQQMTADKGSDALAFFRAGTSDASADQIRQQADALKQWRDMLPSQTEAALIQEINGYLAQSGQAAQQAAGQMMSYNQAIKIGEDGLKNSFAGTNEQLKQAKQVLEEALATTDKNTQKYKDIREALAGIAIEEKRVGDVSAEVQKILDQPKGRSFNELKIAVEQGRKQLEGMDRTTRQGQADFDALAEKVKQADLEMKNVSNSAKGTASSFEKAWTRLKTYVTFYVGAAAALQKLGSTIDDLMTLSDKMGEVRKTTGFTADEVGRLSDSLAKLDSRTPLNDLMNLSAEAGQLGLTTQADIEGFTKAANEMLVALPEMGQESATEMMKIAIATGEVGKIQKQMNDGTVQGSSATAVAMEKIGSTIDRLRASTAAAAPPIADFVKRVGAVGAQSGISVDQVAALGATVDSLGMGTEMAATAISRMIPAIKNNAFDVAKAIGVTPDSLRELFDAGKGMEAVLMVLQKMKDEDMGPDSIEKMLGQTGMQGIMQELDQQGARAGIVFAGLSQNVDVLRQNLETANQAYQDGTAITSEYEKMNETAAAKWERLKNQVEEFFVSDSGQRWLSTMIELLRKVVDLITGNGGLSVAFRTILLSIGLMRTGIGDMFSSFTKLSTSIKSVGVAIGLLDKQTKAVQWGNLIVAAAGAFIYLAYSIYHAGDAERQFQAELAHLDAQEAQAEREVNNLTNSFNESNQKATEAAQKQSELQQQTNSLRKEVEILRGSTNKSTDSTNRLRIKQEQLRQKEGELKKATDACNSANGERSRLISQINSKYNTYLGYMLQEKTDAQQVALAHWQIVDALREELVQKRLNRSLDRVENDTQKGIDNAESNTNDVLKTLPADMQRNIKYNYESVRSRITTQVDSKGHRTYTLPAIGDYGLRAVTADSYSGLRTQLRRYVSKIVSRALDSYYYTTDRNGKKVRARDAKGRPTTVNFGSHYETNPISHSPMEIHNNPDQFRDQLFSQLYNSTELYVDRDVQEDELRRLAQAESDSVHQQTIFDAQNANLYAVNKAYRLSHVSKGDRVTKNVRKGGLSQDDISQAAQQASIIFANFKKFGSEAGSLESVVGKGKALTYENIVNHLYGNLSAKDRQKIINAGQNSQVNDTGSDRNFGGVGETGGGSYSGGTSTSKPYTPTPDNPWGPPNDAASTNWSAMSGDALVARRKQMNNFVRALQEGSDPEQVLSEDPALMKAIKDKKVSNDTDSVIDWYNKQRLQIQNVLHHKYLNNTGNWQDPKKKKTKKGRKRSARKMVKDEMSYYLDSLDAYYTARKSDIETQQGNGEISEAEAWRRNLQNNQIWQQRRGELQQLYSKKAGGVSGDERNAIYDIIGERTGESSDLVKQNIASTVTFIKKVGEKSVPEMRAIYGDLDIGMEKSFQRMRKAVVEQMEAIQDIIDKERPFDGIVKNLKDNTTKMGLLQKDFENQRIALEKKGVDNDDPQMVALNKQYEEELPKRLNFLLGEAEHAYEMTWDKLAADMKKNGYGDWLDAILKSEDPEKAKRAMIAELHSVYDDVQDAVKKEASIVKKQVENTWNDTTLLPSGVSIKNTYEKAINALGVESDQTSRANSMIGAGAQSQRVADRLAIKQLQIQLDMQTHYYNLVRKTGLQRVEDLRNASEEMKKQGKMVEAERYALDAKHAQMSVDLSTTEEETDLAKIRQDILAKSEESEANLYKHLKEWSELFTSSVQSLFEASNTGLGDYYDNLAKMRLTGEGAAGGTYVVIDNSGTKNASAHYETLDGEDALKRQLEIEQKNAVADMWKKVMDDINKKINDEITDIMNAALQKNAIDENTSALVANTQALYALTGGGFATENADMDSFKKSIIQDTHKMWADLLNPPKPIKEGTIKAATGTIDFPEDTTLHDLLSSYEAPNIDIPEGSIKAVSGVAAFPTETTLSDMLAPYEAPNMDLSGESIKAVYYPPLPNSDEETSGSVPGLPSLDELKASIAASFSSMIKNVAQGSNWDNPYGQPNNEIGLDDVEILSNKIEKKKELDDDWTQHQIDNQNKVKDNEVATDKKMGKTSKSMYAAMMASANLYGAAYQAVTNDNLSSQQKFEMIALQAAGQSAMAMLTADMFKSETGAMVSLPQILAECLKINPLAGAAIFAVLSALIGASIGVAMGKLSKGKTQIAQVTGASASAGRLTTGMLTYAEGNVNEFTDPSTLTPGRSYNVDAADGRTYRAKYTGKDAKTHITNGPEFHLVGERGREAIIDAHTTRLLQMDDTGIWQSIQTLYNGGGLRSVRKRGGMRAFASGNLDDFDAADLSASSDEPTDNATDNGMTKQLQTSIDRNNELLQRALDEGIKGVFSVYGKDGLVDSYDRGKKTLNRHGERY